MYTYSLKYTNQSTPLKTSLLSSPLSPSSIPSKTPKRNMQEQQQQQQQQPLTPKQSQPLLPHVVVAMVPSPGMGHLIPMLELAKRLTHHHNLTVTIIIPTNSPPSIAQTTVLDSLPAAISHTFLPPVSLSDLPPDTKAEPFITLTVLRSLPYLRRTLLSFSSGHHRIAALVVDPFSSDAIDVAAELNIPSYLYFPSSAMTLSFTLRLPHLDQTVQCEYRDLPEPVRIPGCVPVQGKDLLDPVQDRNNEAYRCFLHHASRFRLAHGIIENSFFQLEPGAIKELQKGESGRPPVYPVGPLVNVDGGRTGVHNGTDDQCLRWLDEQPRGSVLFVCFGSGGTLSSAQIDELAMGLEMSQQRFLWVVKSPNDKIANAPYFNVVDNHANPFDLLPKGFEERTRGMGLVVPSWAPQAQVLAHGSIGGFLTHCGWNSILESVVNGVSLIAWPLHAEQKMNAVLVTEDVKVALRPNVGENRLVESEEIASVVKRLMEGEEGKKLRYQMKDLKEAAAKALGGNGSSTKQITDLALMWKGQTTV